MTVIDQIAGVNTSVVIKAPVRVASASNIVLSGLQTVDGEVLAAGDRVLAWGQTDAVENGVYDVSSNAWTRSLDFNGDADVVRGTKVLVLDGTYSQSEFYLTTDAPVIDTSEMTFTQLTLPDVATITALLTSIQADIATNASDIALRALINSEALTGTPTAPTPALDDISTKIATTEFVDSLLGAENAAPDDLNDVDKSGTYGVDSSTTQNKPLANGVLLHFERQGSSGVHLQVFLSRTTGSLGEIFVRSANANVWTAWVQSATQDYVETQFATTDKIAPAVIRPVTPGDLSLGRYGAIGTGSSSVDTQAWQDVCQDVFDAGGGIVRVPPGRFLIEAAGFTSTQDIGDAEGNGVTIQGAGDLNTVFETEGKLFDWETPTARDIALQMMGFSIHMATAGDNGTLVRATQVEGGLSSTSRVHVQNVSVRPASSVYETAYFDTAFLVNNVYWPKFVDCEITQPRGGAVTLATTQLGSACIDLDGCYGPEIYRIKAWGAARGLSYDVTANPGGEGGYIRDSVFVHNIVGAYVRSAGTEPALEISGSHFNNKDTGLHLIQKKLVDISKCLFYNVETSAYTDVLIDNCDIVNVDYSRFHFGGNTSRKHIHVTGGSTNSFFRHNIHNSDGTAHELDSGTDTIDIFRPWYGPEVDTQVNNLGATNVTITA